MVQIRKEALVTTHYYHIFNRSIAKFTIFNAQDEFDRFYQLVNLYRFANFKYKYSQFLELLPQKQSEIISDIVARNNCLVEIVAYCLMPTHIHLLLKQTQDNGIAKFMARALNGYSRYFNTKHQRTGPLWSGRFKSVLVSNDEQLLHLTRYIHLNPTSAALVDNPIDWSHSSYDEYVGISKGERLCVFKDIIDMNKSKYRKFAEDHKGYQRDLSIIKYLTIDNYSG